MNQSNQREIKGFKLWLFRALAVGIGLLPLVISEAALYLSGWQPSNSIEDPYVGFSSVRPLFVPSSDESEMKIAENRKPLFCDDSFRSKKNANEFRVFCVGGSTVQGRPFAIQTSFTHWLELSLSIADPDRQYEVVNCGGVSYASYRLAPIVEEILNYEPDLVIIYTGHNEFLEDRTYSAVKSLPTLVTDTHGWLSRCRTYGYFRSLFVTAPSPPTGDLDAFQMPTEVEARLDFANGLYAYHRDDDWIDRVMHHYEINILRMILACRKSKVPVVFVNPVSNIRDAAPFKSEINPALTAKQQSTFLRLLDSTQRSTVPSRDDLLRDKAALLQAIEIDPRHAMAQFRLGQTYLSLGDPKAARPHLIRAKEEDICPLRILAPMATSLRRLTTDQNVPLIDADAFFAKKAPDGLVGARSLVDHVHPSIAGHQQLAREILDRLIENRLVPVSAVQLDDTFQSELARRTEKHLSELPYLYFELGKDRLKGLERWASGKVTKQRPKEKLPENPNR